MASSPSVSRPRTAAFTLIELLVVVGVIALLIGILLPVLSGARQRGRSAVCLSNLRQIGLGIDLYAAGNKGVLPPGFEGVYGTATPWQTDWALRVASTLDPTAPADYGEVQQRTPSAAGGTGWAAGTLVLTSPPDGTEFLRCPEVLDGSGWSHYGPHPRAMPWMGSTDFAIAPVLRKIQAYKIGNLSQSSTTLLVGDSVLSNRRWDTLGVTHQASPSMTGLDDDAVNVAPSLWRPRAETIPGYFARNVRGGDNRDIPPAGVTAHLGTLRFRHGTAATAEDSFRGAVCNLLYADGHAEPQVAAGAFAADPSVLDTGLDRRRTLLER